jgi:hypothetical protein
MNIDLSSVRFIKNGEPHDASVYNRPFYDYTDALEEYVGNVQLSLFDARDETIDARDIAVQAKIDMEENRDLTLGYRNDALNAQNGSKFYRDESESFSITSTNASVAAINSVIPVMEAQALTNALLGLGVGTSIIDNNGNLIMTYFEYSVNDLKINNSGELILSY